MITFTPDQRFDIVEETSPQESARTWNRPVACR
jgi:hypothetical protein